MGIYAHKAKRHIVHSSPRATISCTRLPVKYEYYITRALTEY